MLKFWKCIKLLELLKSVVSLHYNLCKAINTYTKKNRENKIQYQSKIEKKYLQNHPHSNISIIKIDKKKKKKVQRHFKPKHICVNIFEQL